MYRPVFFGQTRSEHDYSNDGRNIPRVLGLLCFNQYRRHETLYLGSAKRALPNSHVYCVEELSRDTQLTQGLATVHSRERDRYIEVKYRSESFHHDQVHHHSRLLFRFRACH